MTLVPERKADRTKVHTPALYDATVTHTRRALMHRAFSHPVYMWLVDLDDMPRFSRPLRPFCGFHAADHLGDPGRGIAENVRAYLAEHGVESPARIVMLANARVLGYVFNPLSVFWCYRADGELACIVAEVHNTYHERHCYLLHPDSDGRVHVDKEFYVSPFLPMGGHYVMRFSPPGETLSVTIALRQDGETTFSATLRGTRTPASTRGVLRQVLRRPLMSQRVSALIRRHGIALWLRRVPVIKRPEHTPQRGVG